MYLDAGNIVNIRFSGLQIIEKFTEFSIVPHDGAAAVDDAERKRIVDDGTRNRLVHIRSDVVQKFAERPRIVIRCLQIYEHRDKYEHQPDKAQKRLFHRQKQSDDQHHDNIGL